MSSETSQHSTLLELTSGIIAALPDGLVSISEDGQVNLINCTAIELLNLNSDSPKTFLDIHFTKLLERLPDLVDKLDKLLICKKHKELNLRHVALHGRKINIQCFTMLKGVLIVVNEANDDALHQFRENTDILTQLSNRTAFESIFVEFIERTKSTSQNAALVFLDIDNFKVINDTYGHSFGDDVICKVANTLRSKLAANQPIARIAGDQFAVLFENSTVHEVLGFVQNIGRFIDTTVFDVDGSSIRLTISSGVAPFFTNSAPQLTTLLSMANTACKSAKEHGKNRIQVLDNSDQEFEGYIEGVKRIEEINQALQAEDFVLFGQKIAPISQKTEQGYYEVLLRMRNKNGDLLSPYTFIPIAERYHLMPEIDRYVFASLCRTMHSHESRSYSVNLSGQTVSDRSLVDFVNKMLSRYVFNPEDITFEITETAAMSDFHGTIEVMNELRALGFKFSLDDFGTGLSSFTYLKELPLDTVKIDGSFVRDMVTDEISYQMVKSVHDIGSAMGMNTVAEFVENIEIYRCLEEIGVGFAQGYYIHKPELLSSL